MTHVTSPPLRQYGWSDNWREGEDEPGWFCNHIENLVDLSGARAFRIHATDEPQAGDDAFRVLVNYENILEECGFCGHEMEDESESVVHEMTFLDVSDDDDDAESHWRNAAPGSSQLDELLKPFLDENANEVEIWMWAEIVA